MPKQGRLYVPLDVAFVDEYAHMSSDAVRLFFELLSFTKRVGTDGCFTSLHVRRATALEDPQTALRELFDAGLIEANLERNGVCFEVFIPSFAAWNDEATAKQKAGQKGGVASGIARRAAKQIEAPSEANTKHVLEQEEKRREEKEEPNAASPSAQRVSFEDDFAEIWTVWPKRQDARKPGLNAYCARRIEGIEHQALFDATRNYAQLVATERRENSKIMDCKTFFGPNERFVPFLEPPEAAVASYNENAFVREMQERQERWDAEMRADEMAGA